MTRQKAKDLFDKSVTLLLQSFSALLFLCQLFLEVEAALTQLQRILKQVWVAA